MRRTGSGMTTRDNKRETRHERRGERGRTREPLSRRMTGAESQRHPKELKRTQEDGQDVPSDATPPKRAQPVPVRYHTDLGGDVRPKEPAARYRGTEPSDPRRGGHTSTSERRVHKNTRVSHERRRLFDNDAIEQDGFIDHFMEAAEATSQPELDGIIAVMDKEQLVASLQHMALQLKTLQGDATATVLSGNTRVTTRQGSQHTRQQTHTRLTSLR